MNWRWLILLIFPLILGMGTQQALGESSGNWTISRFSESPVTTDGHHAVEGTQTPPPWAWYARFHLRYQFGVGRAPRASQFTLNQTFGLGFPKRLALALSFPVGWTLGAKEPAGTKPGPRSLEGMAEDGPGIGDLRPALLFSVFENSVEKGEEGEESGAGGFGLLFGLVAGIPTGHHDRLMGEGGFTLEPMASLAFQIFGSRLALNVAYRWRPEHVSWVNGRRFEQDDEIVWRVGVRVPKKNDVAWSIEAEGAVGILTDEKGWPSSDQRPVVIGAGIDMPAGRLYRIGLNASAGVSGVASPGVTFGISFWWLPVLPDEDEDGISGLSDECQLLKEDWDGFQDHDGCPDLDNDKDGWPDTEDRCPLTPADDFSDDGCISE